MKGGKITHFGLRAPKVQMRARKTIIKAFIIVYLMYGRAYRGRALAMEGDHRREEREEINQNEIHMVRSGHEQPQRSLSFSVRRSEERGI